MSLRSVLRFQYISSLIIHYTGTYYSEELAAEYKVDLVTGKLWMHHMRLGDFELQPDPITADQFSCQVGSIQFVKNDEKKIIGFRLSGGRVKNLRFDKKL